MTDKLREAAQKALYALSMLCDVSKFESWQEELYNKTFDVLKTATAQQDAQEVLLGKRLEADMAQVLHEHSWELYARDAAPTLPAQIEKWSVSVDPLTQLQLAAVIAARDAVTPPAQRVMLTDDDIWNNDEIMAINAESGLTMTTISRLARTLIETYERKNAVSSTTTHLDHSKEQNEWGLYLKDGETPFERFMRERKDLDALMALYQTALKENESLKEQQGADAVPVYWEVCCDLHPVWLQVNKSQFDEYVSQGWKGRKLYAAL